MTFGIKLKTTFSRLEQFALSALLDFLAVDGCHLFVFNRQSCRFPDLFKVGINIHLDSKIN